MEQYIEGQSRELVDQAYMKIVSFDLNISLLGSERCSICNNIYILSMTQNMHKFYIDM